MKTQANIFRRMLFNRVKITSLIFLTISLVIPLKVFGQFSQKHESVFVHLNKLVYIAGETIKYRAYVVDPSTSNQESCSKILYFTIISNKDKSQVSWRINLQDKPEYCYFTLPDNIKPGMYILHAYTNWMRNGTVDSYYSQNLLIMSLSNATPDTIMVSTPADADSRTLNSTENSENGIKVKASKSSYTVNEKVRLEVSLTGNESSADLSVSVSSENPFSQILNPKDITSAIGNAVPDRHQSASSGYSAINNSGSWKYLREDNAFILYGRIKRRNENLPLAGNRIFLSVIDSIAPRILYSRTDSSGAFTFYLNRTYDNKKLFLQLADQSKSADYFWELDSKTIDEKPLTSTPWVLNTNEKSFLNNAKNLRLIEAVYNSQKVKNETESSMKGINYFSPPDLIAIPAEYSDLVNFKEIADNIVPIIKFGLRNDSYSIQILNSKTSQWRENNMVILNGVPFTDLAYIATLGTKDIKRIEVISSNFMVGDITFPGFVSIYTNDNKIPEIYLKNSSVTYKNTVISKIMGGEKIFNEQEENTSKHLPDFRNNLYWKPGIIVTGKEAIVLEFPVSKLTGKYIVSIQGLTLFGQPVSGNTSFEVKE